MATVNKNFRVKNGLVVEGTTGTINGQNILTAASSTTDLAEGANLYFTDERAQDAFAALLTGGTQTNITVTYDDANNTLSFVAESGVDNSTTDDLSEGTNNLYFTDERAQDSMASAISAGTHENITITYDDQNNSLSFVAENGVDDSTTDDLSEGLTNLYFTDERAQDAIGAMLTGTQTNITVTYDDTTGTLSFIAENGVDDSTTDDLDEGTTNLYHTATRVYNKTKATLVEGTGVNLTPNDGTETITVDVDTTEIATKTYVDEVAQGLKVRGNVEAATSADLGAVYSNGTNGVDATLTIPATATLVIDGWSDWSQFDGILVKDQTNPIENGRYFVFVVGDASTDWVLKRCIQCDESEEIPGSYVFVQHGTQYGATGWVATVDNLGTFQVGIDDIDWVQFSGAGTYVGGTGIDIDGQNISVDFTEFDADDINEGAVNFYYTDQKVLDVIDTITTDDVSEGITNLYFTDQRAVDAIEAVVPSFNAVEITSSLQKASAITVPTAATDTAAFIFNATEYRSGKFLVKASFGAHTQISELLVTLDTSDNVAITEYAIVATNGNLVDVSAIFVTGDVQIIVNAANANTLVKVFGTLIV